MLGGLGYYNESCVCFCNFSSVISEFTLVFVCFYVRGMIKAFEKIDKDGSGNVPHEDAVEILQSFVKDIPESSLRGLLTRFDTNNDNMVNFKEFIDFYEKVSEK